MNIEFYLTTECNMKCEFCGAWNQYQKGQYISYEKICEILISAKSEGFKYLTFSGGEPFLHNRLLDIVDFASDNGYYVNISTNGLLLDEEKLDRLSSKNVNIRVSFHSLNRNLHEKITGGDTFEKVLSTIRLLKEKRSYYSIGSTIFEDNLEEVEGLADFALENNAVSIRFTPVFSVYEGRDIKLNSEFYEKMLVKIITVAIKNKRFLNYKKQNNMFLYDYLNILTTRRCSAASNLYTAVDANLNVIPCPVIPHYEDFPTVLYNSMDDFSKLKVQFDNIFNDEFTESLEGICGECTFKSVCQGGCISIKLSSGLKLNAEQPICIKNILNKVIKNFNQKDLTDIIHYWQFHNNKRTDPREGNKSCIRRLPIWELNYKLNYGDNYPQYNDN